MSSPALATRAAAAAVILILASGYIVARSVAPRAEPLTFLTVRFALTALVMAAIVWLSGVRWPATAREWLHISVAGVLLQAIMLGTVFWSVREGLPAGVCSLILALQPLLTGLLAGPVLGERVTARVWSGLFIGMLGAGMVLAPRIVGDNALPLAPVIAALCGLISIAFGTVWQKRTGQSGDLRVSVAIQFIAAFVFTAPAAFLLEEMRFDGSAELWLAMAWSVLGTSAAGILLMLWLLRRMPVSTMSALFYLIPVTAAAMTWLAFDERLTTVQIAGMAIAVVGVWLTNRPQAQTGAAQMQA